MKPGRKSIHETNHRTCCHQWATTRKGGKGGGPTYAMCIKCGDQKVWSFGGEK